MEWREIDVLSQGIDDAFRGRARRLDQAEFRPIGLVPDELGIEGNIRALVQLGAEGLKISRIRDNTHGQLLAGFVPAVPAGYALWLEIHGSCAFGSRRVGQGTAP